MTKEARDAERLKAKRIYRKCMVRVRFPDEVMLQASFASTAPVSAVLEWVSECLRSPAPFELAVARAPPLSELSLTLEQAELCPAALLNFRSATAEMVEPPYLVPQLMSALTVMGDEAVPIGEGGETDGVMGVEGDGRPVRPRGERQGAPAWMRQGK